MGGGGIEFWREENKNLVEEEFFQVGGGWRGNKHVPKWLYYFCKIWALFVSQIYMVYIYIYIYLLVCSVFVIQ